MDDALRQRLVGAAVIIALAVIFLPMFLDSPEPAPTTQQMDLAIPPRPEAGVETRRLPMDPAMSAPQPVSEAVLEPAGSDVAEPTPPPAATPPQPAVTEPAAPAAAAAIERKPTPAPAPAPTTAAPASASASPEPAPAPAPPAAPAPKPPAPATGGRFVAQFGSYADRSNAEALVRDLGKAGVPASIEAVSAASGRSLHRVRSQAYATRADAEAARLSAQRQIAGLQSTVVELARADATQSDPRPAQLSGWAVQVGVFSRKQGADELIARLRAAGYAAFSEPVRVGGGQTGYRVRVGPELKRENAVRIQGELRAKMKLADALVVAHP